MAIRKEKIEGGFIKTYSTSGFYIFGGNPEGNYEEAIDPEEAHREYIETDIPIEEPTDEDYIEAAKIMLGEEDI